MDYEIGSVADLISGTFTPNRPKLTKRALTPIKHKLSPNVTPKSCSNVVKEDFLSPSIRKKNEVAKRTPKRIFQKIDSDVPTSKDLGENISGIVRNLNNSDTALNTSANEATEADSPKKKKKKERNLSENHHTTELVDKIVTEQVNNQESESFQKNQQKKKKKKDKRVSSAQESIDNVNLSVEEDHDTTSNKPQELSPKSELKKAKKKKFKDSENNTNYGHLAENVDENEIKAKKKKNRNKSKRLKLEKETFDSESEHESDNDVASETEQEFKNILKETTINKDGDDSSDDDQNEKKKEIEEQSEVNSTQKSRPFIVDETEVSRTLFVGNVPISKKIKKDVKKLFNKYGLIESVRIRTIPVQDMHTSPKVALLTNKIHPERSTVNVYVKFKDASSVEKALGENNTLMGENHLRVTRSDSAGEYHDPRKTLFVGNLPFSLEDNVLRGLFEKCGSIDSVRIIRDKKLQIGKGFGYVNFAKADGVELALNLSEDDLKIGNRVLRVKRYTLTSGKGKDKLPRHQTNRPGSHPGRGGFHQRSRGGYAGGQAQRFPQEQTGAFRRINNKINKNQGNPKGAWGDKQKTFENKGEIKTDQPKEKKPKKEFVGLTAERKKPKKKFNKDEKKKRQLSEILTKN